MALYLIQINNTQHHIKTIKTVFIPSVSLHYDPQLTIDKMTQWSQILSDID